MSSKRAKEEEFQRSGQEARAQEHHQEEQKGRSSEEEDRPACFKYDKDTCTAGRRLFIGILYVDIHKIVRAIRVTRFLLFTRKCQPGRHQL